MSKNSPYTIPNSAKLLRNEFGIRERQMEPARSASPHQEFVTVIMDASVPKKVARMWDSLKKQTHRRWQLIFVNTMKSEWPVRRAYKAEVAVKVPDGYDSIYLAGQDLNIVLPHIKHDKIVFLGAGWCWEPGHIESLLTFEKKVGKRPIAAYRILGKVGGWDLSEVKFPNMTNESWHMALTLFTKKDLLEKNFRGSRYMETFVKRVVKSGKKACTRQATVVFDYNVKFPDAPTVKLSQLIRDWRSKNNGRWNNSWNLIGDGE